MPKYAENFLSPGDLFGSGGRGVGERVGDAELLPLAEGEGVVGQDFDALHAVEGGDEVPEAGELFRVISETGDENAAYPHGDSVVGEPAGHGQNAVVRLPGEGVVSGGVELLEVEQDEVRVLHEAAEVGIKGLLLGEGTAGGVERGVYPLLFGQAEELRHEFHLQQRLAPADGDTAVILPIVAIAQGTLQQGGRLPLRASLQGPGLRVVAIAAAHHAALHKDHEAHPRAIHQTEGL